MQLRRIPGSLLRPLGAGLLNLAYPPRCVSCSARTEAGGLPLCPACLREMERATASDTAERLDRLPSRALDRAWALWVFAPDGPLQAVQHAIKYGNRPQYGEALGRLMGTAWVREHDRRPRWVVPIPLHRLRHLERGYNQSTMLARGVADALAVPLRTDLLYRPHPTQTQTTLTRAQRWANVDGAFTAPPTNVLIDSPILLIDDVLTTGSTATAAARALRAAGASTVQLATLAVADP